MRHAIITVTILTLTLGAGFAGFAAGRYYPVDMGHVPTEYAHCGSGCDADILLPVAEYTIRQMSGRLCVLNQKEYCREMPELTPQPVEHIDDWQYMPRDGQAGQTIRCGEWVSHKHHTRGFYNCGWASMARRNHSPAESH